MEARVLFCCDLDRTVLPNGAAPESALARPLFREVARDSRIVLAYASGRDRGLVREAMTEFDVPAPAFAICSVGAEICTVGDGGWEPWQSWREHIGDDWGGRTSGDLAQLLEGLKGLELQPEARQEDYKLSYFLPADEDPQPFIDKIEERFAAESVASNLIFSVDEEANVGLLDVLPRRAAKHNAVRFLAEREGYPLSRVVYAGDSGNDLAVFESEIPSVAVRNVAAGIKDAVERLAADPRRRVHLAQGDFLGMNGNYAAGALEGLAQHRPETRPWLEEALARVEKG